MKASTKKFELKYIRTRNGIERKGIRLIQSALAEQYRQFISRAMDLPPSMWDNIKISEEPIEQFFKKFYPMSAPLGQMTRKHILWQKDPNAKKSLEDDLYLSVYERYMQKLVGTSDYAARIKTITNTTSERINTVIQQVLTDAEIGGFGIDKIKQNLTKAIGSSIRGNVRARAKAIAQTEMISASNQASTFAADSTGLEYRKYWSTSHLQGIRPSHIQAEQDSIQRGGLRKDEPFSNGLMFPGDPAGSADEVCNCRCSVLHEIV
jgi:hypothetical protein